MKKRNGKKSVARKILTINERRVKALLAERGWTQHELSIRTGVELSCLNRIIRNERYANRHIDKIAAALGVSIRRILDTPPVVLPPVSTSTGGEVVGPALAAAGK